MSFFRKKFIFPFCNFAMALLLAELSFSQMTNVPDTVTIPSGSLQLKAFLWKPKGSGPFPAVLFCHGSVGGSDTIHDPIKQFSQIGPVFASHGYLFLGLFRRGAGLSEGQGVNSTILMENAFKEGGQEARNKIQLEQLRGDQLQDMIAGLKWLEQNPKAGANKIMVCGHSFGGSLAIIFAAHEPQIKAVILFAAGGYSWDRSASLREELLNDVKKINSPTIILYAQNDYSLHPAYAVDSIMNLLHTRHVLKIYPQFGKTAADGHDLLYSGIEIWETDLFEFLKKEKLN